MYYCCKQNFYSTFATFFKFVSRSRFKVLSRVLLIFNFKVTFFCIFGLTDLKLLGSFGCEWSLKTRMRRMLQRNIKFIYNIDDIDIQTLLNCHHHHHQLSVACTRVGRSATNQHPPWYTIGSKYCSSQYQVSADLGVRMVASQDCQGLPGRLRQSEGMSW